ncbi:putative secretory lipase [Trichoderma sp. SZMC 28014]
MKATYATLLFAASSFAIQLPTLGKPISQSTAFNSSFKFSPDQIKLGQLWPELAEDIETILNFDRSQLAHGGPSQDSFYTLDKKTTIPKIPGQVLKVEHITNPAEWNIPAGTSLSRFIYASTTANGTLVPASAYVLWPFTAKKLELSKQGQVPVVLWSHGTSGYFADGSPSSHRALFYHNIMPFTLAQAGYAVVASDYTGLGINSSWDGSYVPHQYQNRLANGFDSLYALRAARSAFSGQITNEYVNVGHSQGGAAAWGVSEILAENSDKMFNDLEGDYLGSIIFAPGINLLLGAPQVACAWIGKDLDLMYPDFKLSDWLSPLGIARTELLTEIQGGQYVSQELFLANATEMLNPAWNESWYASTFNAYTNPGNRPYKAPMIMFAGTNDILPLETTMSLAQSTCENYHSGSFEFVTITGAAHFSSMDTTRQQWLRWIEDRFNRKALDSTAKCPQSTINSVQPIESYQILSTSFPQWAGEAGESYELVAGGF